MPDQQVVRQVAAVQPNPTSTGRSRWTVTDDQNQEWTVWEAPLAMQAQSLLGQMALMTVRIAPARDPQYGMNYTLRAIMAAPQGAQPSPPMPLAQGPAPMQMSQPMVQAQMPGVPALGMPSMQSMPQQMPEVLRPPAKTLGQGGNLSDADITRMARSTAISAVVGAAFSPEDFRDVETGELDWSAIYAAAEAVAKFVLFRRHEGWQPGVEIDAPTNEQQVLAEVHAQFPGAVELPGMAPQASAEEADGGEIGWGE